MATTSDNNGLLLALVVGGALYYLYQRQQALATQYGVENNLTGDIETFAQNVTNTVENATIGSSGIRGIRNNNPGNIRHVPGWPTTPDQAWQGMSATQTDNSFIQFVDALHGIRALHVVLNTYYTKYELDTVTGLISRWAPPQDKNNTVAYIAFVSNSMDVGANDVLNMTDIPTMTALVHAIIVKENTVDPYLATGQLAQAMAMA